jgi:hypothetical protein
MAGEVPRSRCRSGARAAAKPATATHAHQRKQVRTGCHRCARVRTGAHGCAAGAGFHTVSHIAGSANKLPQRAATYNVWCLRCARCRVVSKGGANAARGAGDGMAGEAPRSRFHSAGCAAGKPAGATRARQRTQVRTGCHTCGLVPTRAHGCAAGAAFQTVLRIALRTSRRSAQLVITRWTRSVRAAESCHEAGRTLLARPATAWQAKRRGRRAAAALRVPQPSQLQPRVRISASRCAQGAAGAHGCARVLTGAQQVPHSGCFALRTANELRGGARSWL